MSKSKKVSNLETSIRTWLVNRRIELKLTQLLVANSMGLQLTTYNQIECGKQGFQMNAPRLLALAKVLQMPVEDVCIKETKYLISIVKKNPNWRYASFMYADFNIEE